MKVNVGKITTACVIFFMQANYFLGMSSYSKTSFGNILEIISFLLAIFFLFFHYATDLRLKIRVNQILVIVGTAIFATLSVVLTGGGTIVKMLIFALAFRGTELKYVLRCFYKSNIILILFVSASVVSGVIGETKMWKRGVYAYGFGFNPNILALGVFFTAIIYLYINYEKIKRIWWAGILVTAFLDSVTQSRAAAGLLLLTIIAVFLEKAHLFPHGKSVQWVAQYAFLGLTIVSYFIAANFNINNSTWMQLNQLMSSRPYLYNLYYSEFPISLMGNFFNKENYGAMDNTYLMLLFRYGIVIYLIYFFIFYYAIKYAMKANDYLVVIVSLIYIVYFFVEYSASIMNFDFVLVYFWVVIWGGVRNEKAEKNKRSSSCLQL